MSTAESGLTELARLVRQFAEEVVAPVSYEADRTKTLPMDVVAQMGDLGLFGLPFPEEYGGQGGDYFALCLAIEALARVDQSLAITLEAGVSLGAMPVFRFGTEEQKQRFLPGIKTVTELWCQGYSEPGAGSDLANVSTTARLDGDQWVVNGQKVWTSLAHLADWCFVVARTEPGSSRHKGLSYLLVPMNQEGVEVRPIIQLTGTSEFNEVFFDNARTDADLVVGGEGNGWGTAMGTLTFERGVSTLGQQIGFARELESIVELAERNGAAENPAIRNKISRAWTSLQVIRAHALRTLASVDASANGGEASVAKLLWANWHRGLGELAMEVQGAASLIGVENTEPGEELNDLQRLWLFTRADTIYGGSNEIQRNIIAERVLGLPREARP